MTLLWIEPWMGGRGPWGRSALLSLAMLLGAHLIGCGPHDCEPSSCPAPVSVVSFCGTSGRCRVDGTLAPCGPRPCLTHSLPHGSVLSVPMRELPADLTVVPDLVVAYAYGGGPEGGVYPDPMKAIVLLDGVAGEPHQLEGPFGHVTAFHWASRAAQPETLEFSYTDGDEPVDLDLHFEFAACSVSEEICEG